jgi:dihydroorotate dehydrogenase electron transfer subunit
MTLGAPEVAAAAMPGQFAMLRTTFRADPLLPRAYSFLDADPDTGQIEVLYRVVGAGTRVLSELRPGARVSLWGPMGVPFAPAASGRHLLVGGGVGVPPIVFLASRLARRPIQVLIGAATAEYLVGIDELPAAGVPVSVSTDDGSRGARGFVTDLLRDALAAGGDEGTTVYACGPMPMLAAVARICAAGGVACQVALEAPMACGVGACLGCTVARRAGGYARVCTEGPVFDAGEVEWDALQAGRVRGWQT